MGSRTEQLPRTGETIGIAGDGTLDVRGWDPPGRQLERALLECARGQPLLLRGGNPHQYPLAGGARQHLSDSRTGRAGVTWQSGFRAEGDHRALNARLLVGRPREAIGRPTLAIDEERVLVAARGERERRRP